MPPGYQINENELNFSQDLDRIVARNKCMCVLVRCFRETNALLLFLSDLVLIAQFKVNKQKSNSSNHSLLN